MPSRPTERNDFLKPVPAGVPRSRSRSQGRSPNPSLAHRTLAVASAVAIQTGSPPTQASSSNATVHMPQSRRASPLPMGTPYPSTTASRSTPVSTSMQSTGGSHGSPGSQSQLGAHSSLPPHVISDALDECAHAMSLSRESLARFGSGKSGHVHFATQTAQQAPEHHLCLKLLVADKATACAEYAHLEYAWALYSNRLVEARVPKPYGFHHVRHASCRGLIYAILMRRIEHAETLEKVITERLEGKAITEHGISSFNTRIALARKLCDIAITYRRYGVVHADLTWENILVQVNPSEFKIVIIDFGISGYFPALNEHSATTSYIFRPTSRWIWPTPAPGGREQPQIVGQYLLKTYGALSHHIGHILNGVRNAVQTEETIFLTTKALKTVCHTQLVSSVAAQSDPISSPLIQRPMQAHLQHFAPASLPAQGS